MQTFLPYPSFRESARVLDRSRLGKQRVEVLQLLNALMPSPLPSPQKARKGWRNHPACRMWENHPYSLALYGLDVCREWIRRGYQDTCFDKILTVVGCLNYETVLYRSSTLPDWVGGPIHESHRSNLLRKDREWYSRYGWEEPDDLPYFWPVG